MNTCTGKDDSYSHLLHRGMVSSSCPQKKDSQIPREKPSAHSAQLSRPGRAFGSACKCRELRHTMLMDTMSCRRRLVPKKGVATAEHRLGVYLGSILKENHMALYLNPGRIGGKL